MIGKTNAGSSKSVALIRVLYPAGNTVTCTNGTITYQSDASGDYLFGLPSTGSWTVSGTDGRGVQKSITYVIAEGDGKLVTLDTLIPPADRATYQEVEYIKINGGTNGHIPIPFNTGAGSWDIEFEKVALDIIQFNQRLFTGFTSYITVDQTNSKLIIDNYGTSYTADRELTPYVDHDLVLHVSDVTASPGVSLTADNVVVASGNSAYIAIENEINLGYAGGVYVAMGAKYRVIRIKSSGTTVTTIVPCKRRSDGMPGYYDLSTGTFSQGRNLNSTTLEDVLAVMTLGPGIGT